MAVAASPAYGAHLVVSDIDGLTGMAIIKAIVAGERDARRLAQFRDRRCHKAKKRFPPVKRALARGPSFQPGQALKMYDAIKERIAGYERELLRRMAEMERDETRGQNAPKLHNVRKGQKILAADDEPKRQALCRISGVDLATIDAIGAETIQIVMSFVMSCWWHLSTKPSGSSPEKPVPGSWLNDF